MKSPNLTRAKYRIRNFLSCTRYPSFREKGIQRFAADGLFAPHHQRGRQYRTGNGCGQRRCDLLAEYGGERYVIELKLYRDQFTREDGLEQTARYLDRLGLEHGYLVIFETRSGIPWEERIRREEETVNGKRITVLGM